MTSRLTIVRGLPGSGKSTYAKSLQGVHIEADMYHVNSEGEYDWKPENAKAGHEWCKKAVYVLLCNGVDVVVSNTFTQMWEIDPYIEMGFDYDIIRMTGDYANIHNVPEHIIVKMRNRFEDAGFENYIGEHEDA